MFIMFIILTVVMFPWMCSYVKTYQTVHIKYVQFMKYPLYLKLLKIYVHKITHAGNTEKHTTLNTLE